MSKRKAPGDDAETASIDAVHSMRGKTILITGGAQGLGLEVARMAARRNAKGIVICDRNAANSAQIEKEIGDLGSECLFVQCDVGVPEQITATVEKAEERFGSIEGLVNAAGDTTRGDLDSTDVDQWDRQQHVNLRAVFLFTQHVSQLMRRKGVRGSIVNIASVQAYGGLTFCMGTRHTTVASALVLRTRPGACGSCVSLPHRVRCGEGGARRAHEE